MAVYQGVLSSFMLYQRDLIAAGSLAISAAFFLVFATGKFKVFRFYATFALSGASAWLFISYLQIAQSNLNLLLFRIPFPFSVGWFHPAMMEGELAFALFACACLGLLLVCRLFGLGWLRSTRMTFAIFAVPRVLLFEGGLAVLFPGLMPLFVITHATWKWGGTYILSNQNVLYIALAIAAPTYLSMWRWPP